MQAVASVMSSQVSVTMLLQFCRAALFVGIVAYDVMPVATWAAPGTCHVHTETMAAWAVPFATVTNANGVLSPLASIVGHESSSRSGISLVALKLTVVVTLPPM